MKLLKSIPLEVGDATAAGSGGLLFAINSPHQMRAYLRFAKFPVTVGRAAENDIVINDTKVEPVHLRIWVEDGQLCVETLGLPFELNQHSLQRCKVALDEPVNVEIGDSRLVISSSGDSNIRSQNQMQEKLPRSPSHEIPQVSPHRTDDSDQTKVSARCDDDNYTVTEQLGDGHYHSDALAFYRRLSVVPDVKAMAKLVLDHIGGIASDVQSSALYIWKSDTCSLKCYAANNYQEIDRRGIDRDLFLQLRRVIRPIKLHSPASALKEPTQTRLVVPMMRDTEVYGFAYLRMRQSPNDVSDVTIAHIYDSLRLAAPLLAHAVLETQLDSWLQGMVDTVLATIGAKDTYTIGHSERVCRFSVVLAKALGLSGDELNKLMFSSLIHDIGKVGIPDAILKKADLLSAEEFEIMRQHPVIGSQIITHMPMADQITAGVKYHHERWDGTGYPDKLSGENIPLFGRIIAITDAFDAMTSGRSYSGYMGVDEAITQLSGMNDLFDPEILKAFISTYERGELTIRTGTALNERLSSIANRLPRSS